MKFISSLSLSEKTHEFKAVSAVDSIPNGGIELSDKAYDDIYAKLEGIFSASDDNKTYADKVIDFIENKKGSIGDKVKTLLTDYADETDENVKQVDKKLSDVIKSVVEANK